MQLALQYELISTWIQSSFGYVPDVHLSGKNLNRSFTSVSDTILNAHTVGKFPEAFQRAAHFPSPRGIDQSQPSFPNPPPEIY